MNSMQSSHYPSHQQTATTHGAGGPVMNYVRSENENNKSPVVLFFLYVLVDQNSEAGKKQRQQQKKTNKQKSYLTGTTPRQPEREPLKALCSRSNITWKMCLSILTVHKWFMFSVVFILFTGFCFFVHGVFQVLFFFFCLKVKKKICPHVSGPCLFPWWNLQKRINKVTCLSVYLFYWTASKLLFWCCWCYCVLQSHLQLYTLENAIIWKIKWHNMLFQESGARWSPLLWLMRSLSGSSRLVIPGISFEIWKICHAQTQP